MKIEKLNAEHSNYIKEHYPISHLCAKVLSAADMEDKEIQELLSIPKLSDPFSAKGMKEVADRIYQAKIQKEKVLVCGDYDADGICSTAILVDALRKYGVTCGFYIPNRFKEGYGLHVDTVHMAYEKGYRLLITVDNGVKAFDALKEAKRLGIEVIITDHHAMEEELDCLYLLHPFHMGDAFSTLSGAGVALEISRALLPEIKEHVVLACVAAIADVMELRKETRAIVKLGIQYLKQGVCKPIQMLAKDRYPQWDEVLIAYQIVPKLNVIGRLADMANANNAVRYLLLTDYEEIQKVSHQITDLNEKRKKMSDAMVETAKSLIHDEYPFQLLFHDSFHEGIVGLVAGKLAQERNQPVMIAAKSENGFKGSIRSMGLLDLTTFFDGCKEELSSYGGHKAAAGIGFSFDKKQEVQDYVNKKMEGITFENELCYKVIPILENEITQKEVESLSMLAPFGNGFEEPLFLLENLKVTSPKTMGNGKHLKWVLNDAIDIVYFNCEKEAQYLSSASSLSFIANLRINSFMGRKKINIFVAEAF